MGAKTTVSLYLRVDLVEEVKRRKLNMSQLVNDLLEQHLFGNSNNVSEEMLKLRKIEEKLSKVEENIEENSKVVEEIRKEVEKLKAKLQEKQEAKEIEDNLHLIRELREIVFDYLQDYTKFESNCRKIGIDPKGAIQRRLSDWAAEKQIPLPQAVKLFCKAFPQLKHLFEVVEVVG